MYRRPALLLRLLLKLLVGRGRYCGCLEFDADDDGCCGKCGHSEQCHTSYPEKRSAVTIVQELAAGGDLVSLLFTSSLGYRMDDIIPRTYFHQLLDGIEYCHSQKICHGDIKPENLCLNSSAMLKIVDFGLCHELGSSTRGGGGSGVGHSSSGRGSGGGSGWSSCGSGGGSHVHSGCYTAPEILSKNVEFDRQAADVWSCGVVLYMMIAREVPFEYSDGVGPAAMRDRTFPWPASMDEELRSLIRYMLDPNPASRWTIEQVKQHAWYRRPIMAQEDLSMRMADHMQNSWVEQKKHELVKLLQSPQHSHAPRAPGDIQAGGGRDSYSYVGLDGLGACPPAASEAGMNSVDEQPFRLSAAAASPAAVPPEPTPGQTIRQLSFGAAGEGIGGGDGVEEKAPAGVVGDGALHHAQEQQEQDDMSASAKPALPLQVLPDVGADEEEADRDEAEPETETDTGTHAPAQPIPATAVSTMALQPPSARFDANSHSSADELEVGPGSAPTLPITVPTEIGRSGTPELSERKSASAPSLGVAEATTALGDAPPPLSLPRQDSHTTYRDGSGHSSLADGLGYWDLDESTESDNDDDVDSKALPMEGAEAEGEPESDAMDTIALPTQMPLARPHDPPPVAAGRAPGFFGATTGGAYDGATQRSASTAPVSVPSSTLTNRNSKRTHSKTKETKRDRVAAEGSDDAATTGRRAKTKRTLSQTRVASDGREDSRQERRALGISESAAAADQDMDRYKARKRASWRGPRGDPMRMSSTARSGAAADPPATTLANASASASLEPTVRARGSDGPAGVAVHTYISLPGDVTRIQAVEMLTSSLRDMVLDASISRTNSGDVIIRHSSAPSDGREATASRFLGSPTTPQSEPNRGAGGDRAFHVYASDDQKQESHDVAMGTAAAMDDMTVSGRHTSQGSPSASTLPADSGANAPAAAERPPEREALMKAQVYERPPEAGGGAVIAVQRLRGAVLPHLQQFARIKEHVERAASRSGLTPPGAKAVDGEPRIVGAGESARGSASTRHTATGISAGDVRTGAADSGSLGGSIGPGTSTSGAGVSEKAAGEDRIAEGEGLGSAGAAVAPRQRVLADTIKADLEAEGGTENGQGPVARQPADGSSHDGAWSSTEAQAAAAPAGASASRMNEDKNEGGETAVETKNEVLKVDQRSADSTTTHPSAPSTSEHLQPQQLSRPKGMRLLQLSENVEHQSDDNAGDEAAGHDSPMAVTVDPHSAGDPEVASQSTHESLPSTKGTAGPNPTGLTGSGDRGETSAAPVHAAAPATATATGAVDAAGGAGEAARARGAPAAETMEEAQPELDQARGRDKARGTGVADDDSNGSASTSHTSAVLVGESAADADEGERRARRRRRSSDKQSDAAAEVADAAATAGAAVRGTRNSDQFAALDLNRQASEHHSEAFGASKTTAATPTTTGSSDNGVSGSSACDADDNVEAETSSSNGTRRIADSSAVQAASINVVGEKRTPADVGLWDRRHQRASSEEPEEMEPRSLYAYGMRAAGGDGNPDASRGRRAGAAAMPRHHRHVRARLSIEPLSGTSESISEGQRGDESNGVQSQSAVGSDATDAAAE